MRRRDVILASPTLAAVREVDAQPGRPYRLLCPFPAGGIVDAAARALTDLVAAALRRPVVVEQHIGGNGVVAAQQLRQAPANGETWMISTLGTIVSQVMAPQRFPAPEEIAAIALIAYDAPVLVVTSGLAATDMESLIGLARQQPDTLSYLRTGPGSQSHLVMEALSRTTGASFQGIDYRGLPQGLVDLLAGRIQLGVLNSGLVMPHLRSGALRAIATLGPQRLHELHDVPTLDELRLPEANIVGWIMVVTRSGLPPASMARIAEAFRDTLAQPDARERLLRLSLVPLDPANAMKADAFLRDAQLRYKALIATLGIRDN